MRWTKREQLIWATALFEGEGCISRTTPNGNSYILQVTSTDEDVIQRFHSIMKLGKIHMYLPPPHHPQWKTKWAWTCQTAKDVTTLLTMMLPFLCSRRSAKAEEALVRVAKVKKMGVLPSHGTPRKYTLGCRCDKCKIAQSSYARAGYRRRTEGQKHSFSSQFTGVTWDSGRSLWYVSAHMKDKTKYVGRYADEKDAALAYDEAARSLLGKKALLNFPREGECSALKKHSERIPK